MSSNKNLREISLKILTNVLLKEKKLKDEFDYFSKQIDKKNVNFLKNLVYGVLRFKESIDEKIKEYYKKSFDKLAKIGLDEGWVFRSKAAADAKRYFDAEKIGDVKSLGLLKSFFK